MSWVFNTLSVVFFFQAQSPVHRTPCKDIWPASFNTLLQSKCQRLFFVTNESRCIFR